MLLIRLELGFCCVCTVYLGTMCKIGSGILDAAFVVGNLHLMLKLVLRYFYTDVSFYYLIIVVLKDVFLFLIRIQFKNTG